MLKDDGLRFNTKRDKYIGVIVTMENGLRRIQDSASKNPLPQHQDGPRNNYGAKMNPDQSFISVRETGLRIFTLNFNNHYHGSIKEDWVAHRKDFLEIFQHHEIKNTLRLRILRNALNVYSLS